MKIILEYFGDKDVVLPNRFEEFIKKMKVEQQIMESEFIFVNDKKQKSIINNTSTYEKMKQQIPHQLNPRLLVAKKFHIDNNPQQDLIEIQETNFVDIFYNNVQQIPCQCEFQIKQSQDCPYCNGSKKLPINSFKNDLNKYFIEYFKDNFTILKDYIQESYKIQIKSFPEWLLLHKQLVSFDITEEFIFQCTQCRKHFSNQHTVYVKNLEFPQKPICVNCFTKLNYLYQKNYEKLVCLKNTEEDISRLQMPKLQLN